MPQPKIDLLLLHGAAVLRHRVVDPALYFDAGELDAQPDEALPRHARLADLAAGVFGERPPRGAEVRLNLDWGGGVFTQQRETALFCGALEGFYCHSNDLDQGHAQMLVSLDMGAGVLLTAGYVAAGVDNSVLVPWDLATGGEDGAPTLRFQLAHRRADVLAVAQRIAECRTRGRHAWNVVAATETYAVSSSAAPTRTLLEVDTEPGSSIPTRYELAHGRGTMQWWRDGAGCRARSEVRDAEGSWQCDLRLEDGAWCVAAAEVSGWGGREVLQWRV